MFRQSACAAANIKHTLALPNKPDEQVTTLFISIEVIILAVLMVFFVEIRDLLFGWWMIQLLCPQPFSGSKPAKVGGTAELLHLLLDPVRALLHVGGRSVRVQAFRIRQYRGKKCGLRRCEL